MRIEVESWEKNGRLCSVRRECEKWWAKAPDFGRRSGDGGGLAPPLHGEGETVEVKLRV